MQSPELSASSGEPAIRVVRSALPLTAFIAQNVEVATVATTNTDDPSESPDPAAAFSVQDLDPDTGLPVAAPVAGVRVEVTPLLRRTSRLPRLQLPTPMIPARVLIQPPLSLFRILTRTRGFQ